MPQVLHVHSERCPAFAFFQKTQNLKNINSPDLLDSSSITDEGGKDHVDALLDAEEEVHLVLLGHGRQVCVGSGQVATLL